MNGKNGEVSTDCVGTITAEERDDIRGLYERKTALIELLKSLNDFDKKENTALYEKLVKDMAATSAKYQQWFDEKSLKYSWKNVQNGHWRINFETCEVLLVV